MNQVIEGLYVSSLLVANDQNQLKENNINFIISLGCILNNDISSQYLNISYPDLLDTPESFILDISHSCCKIIDYNRQNGYKTLVHCVYGQSRSITVTCIYLWYLSSLSPIESQSALSVTNPFHLEETIRFIRNIRNDICINPGFLSQLLLLTQRNIITCPEYMLLTYLKPPPNIQICSMGSESNYPWNKIWNEKSDIIIHRPLGYRILCKLCKFELAFDPSDVIHDDINYNDFIVAHIDEYWADYRPMRKKDCISFTICNKDFILLSPSAPILKNIHSSSLSYSMGGDITCNCGHILGHWKFDGLLICGDFLSGFMFALSRKEIIKRKGG